MMQVHSHISFIPRIFGGDKLIGCGDITGDVRYGLVLKEDRICHRTLKYSNRRCNMTQYAG